MERGYKVISIKTKYMKAKIGELVEVVNKNRVFGSNQFYYLVNIKMKGKNTPLLLSDHELQGSIVRAKANKEDLIKVQESWFQRFLNLWR